jgi:hypothetical protein
MGLANLLPAMFTIFALVIASHPTVPIYARTILLMICCSAATFSSGNGVISWVLAGAVFARSSTRDEFRRKAVAMAVLAGAFAMNVALYLIGFEKSDHGPVDAYVGGFGAMTHFFFVFLGAPFAQTLPIAPQLQAAASGVILLAMLVIAVCLIMLRSPRESLSVENSTAWLAVAGYAIISAAMASKARVGFGLSQALASRYVSYSLYLPLALIPLSSIALKGLRRALQPRPAVRFTQWTLSILLVVFQITSIPRVVSFCGDWQRNRERDRAALLLLPVLPDNPQLTGAITPKIEHVMTQAVKLDDIGFLHPSLIRSPNAALIEAKAEGHSTGTLVKAFQPDSAHVTCIGWAMLQEQHKAADGVFLTCDNERGEPVIVAGAEMCAESQLLPTFDDPAYKCAGWVATISLDKIPRAIPSAHLTAWALDSQTRQAYRLQGAVDLQLPK